MRSKNGDSKLIGVGEKLEDLFAERRRIEEQIRAVREKELGSESREKLTEKYLQTREVAERFKVTPNAVIQWVRRGHLVPDTKHPDLGFLFLPATVRKFTPPPKGNPKHKQPRSIDSRYMQTKDVAAAFGVTCQSVLNWVTSGYLAPAERHADFGYLFESKAVSAFVPPSKRGHN